MLVAYIDPAIGSMLLQAIAAIGLAGAVVFRRIFLLRWLGLVTAARVTKTWNRMKTWSRMALRPPSRSERQPEASVHPLVDSLWCIVRHGLGGAGTLLSQAWVVGYVCSQWQVARQICSDRDPRTNDAAT